MKFICEQNDFIKSVNYVASRTFNRSTMESLEGILIEAKDNNIKLTTNDLELGIEAIANANIVEEGKILVNANTFSEIIRRLPNTEITISTDENNMLCVECEGSKYKLSTLSSLEFPQIRTDNVDNTIEIEQKIFKNMIKKTTFAVSIDDKRPIYTGCLFSVVDGMLDLVALDGFRLAINKAHVKCKDNINIIIPAKALNELQKKLEDSLNDMVIKCTKNNVIFEFDNCKITTSLLDGNFFDYKRISENDPIAKVVVNTKLFYGSLDRISLVSSSTQQKEKKQPILLDLEVGKMTISSVSTIGNAREEIFLETEGQECSLNYNPRYFIEALKNIEDQEIKIIFTGNNAPTIITSVEEESPYMYIILPMRI